MNITRREMLQLSTLAAIAPRTTWAQTSPQPPPPPGFTVKGGVFALRANRSPLPSDELQCRCQFSFNPTKILHPFFLSSPNHNNSFTINHISMAY